MSAQLQVKRSPNQLDKIRSFIMGKRKKLNDKDKVKLQQLQITNQKLCSGLSRSSTIDMLIGELGISRTKAYQLLREAVLLYGDLAEADKKGMRNIMYESFMRAAELCEKNQDYRAMVRALENAAKVLGLFDAENLFDPNSLALPQVVIFSSDPTLLEPQDIDHEEIK